MNTVFQKDKIGLGKRKRAVARVFLVPGNGTITINKVSGEKYLQYNTNYLNSIWSPLEKLNLKAFLVGHYGSKKILPASSFLNKKYLPSEIEVIYLN